MERAGGLPSEGSATPRRERQGRVMTKADIIENVYTTVGFSKKESAEIVELVFDTIKATLEKGEKIKISGFGNFLVREKNSRVGRNPQTGAEIEISARRVLTFRPSQVLKNVLNAGLLAEQAAAAAAANPPVDPSSSSG
jgi:integration host factor subunit alpha